MLPLVHRFLSDSACIVSCVKQTTDSDAVASLHIHNTVFILDNCLPLTHIEIPNYWRHILMIDQLISAENLQLCFMSVENKSEMNVEWIFVCATLVEREHLSGMFCNSQADVVHSCSMECSEHCWNSSARYCSGRRHTWWRWELGTGARGRY